MVYFKIAEFLEEFVKKVFYSLGYVRIGVVYLGGKPVRKRGFEVISKYKDQNINLPQRATHHAAGYDFEAAEEVVIPSIWKAGWKKGWKQSQMD